MSYLISRHYPNPSSSSEPSATVHFYPQEVDECISSFSTTFKCDLICPKTPDEWTDMPAFCSMSS